MVKIAICGKKNSGKNTAANIFTKYICRNENDYDFRIIAFADPMKNMILEMFPRANKKCLFGPSKLRDLTIPEAFDDVGNPLTYRQALIDIGALGRKYDPDIWIKKFDHTLSSFQSKLVVCPDLRFVNEFQYLKKKNFLLLKIIKDDIPQNNDPTETNQEQISNDQFDYILDNNDDLDHLEKQVRENVIPIIQ